jgi:hypothetical protein
MSLYSMESVLERHFWTFWQRKKRDKRLNVISLKIRSWKVDFYKSAAYDL